MVGDGDGDGDADGDGDGAAQAARTDIATNTISTVILIRVNSFLLCN